MKTNDDGYFIVPRGYSKTGLSYKLAMHKCYEQGKITLEDYYGALGAWMILVDGVPEEEVISQIEQALKEEQRNASNTQRPTGESGAVSDQGTVE